MCLDKSIVTVGDVVRMERRTGTMRNHGWVREMLGGEGMVDELGKEEMPEEETEDGEGDDRDTLESD